MYISKKAGPGPGSVVWGPVGPGSGGFGGSLILAGGLEVWAQRFPRLLVYNITHRSTLPLSIGFAFEPPFSTGSQTSIIQFNLADLYSEYLK